MSTDGVNSVTQGLRIAETVLEPKLHTSYPSPKFSFLNPHDSSDNLLRAEDYQVPVARTFELNLQSGPDGAKFWTEGFASIGWDTVTLP